jgi:hypothetical protein
MKVKDLIAILKAHDPELTLITYDGEYGDQRIIKSCIKPQKVYRLGQCLMLDFDSVDVPTPPYKPTAGKPGDLDFGLSQETGIVTQTVSLPKKGDTVTYGDKTGIVIEARAEYPPNDFPKTHVTMKLKD